MVTCHTMVKLAQDLPVGVDFFVLFCFHFLSHFFLYLFRNNNDTIFKPKKIIFVKLSVYIQTKSTLEKTI